MIRTALCEMLDIEHPIIQAGMGTSASAQLAAAVSNAGALGSIGNLMRPAADLRRQLDLIRDLTQRPYALNHTIPTLDEEAFQLSLDAKPRLMSFALADPGDYVRRAHDAGILVMHQVTTVAEAVAAARAGTDIIVAQGGESGGYSGSISTMVLVPQVVDAVRPVPVVAAGGIFDGRGFAAALMLGAVGINVGTRFLAADEAPIPQAYKEMIAGAASEDTMQFTAFNRILPGLVAGGYDVAIRTLKTDFAEEWESRLGEVDAQQSLLLEQIGQAAGAGRLQEIVAPAGQTSGGIRGILSASDIVVQLVEEAEAVLNAARGLSLP